MIAAAAERLWYAAPLVVSVSLCYAATRHEATPAILAHAARFAVWVVTFMAAVVVAMQVLNWLQQ